MNPKYIMWYLILFLLTLLTACNMESDVDVPASKPKLVVSGFISPETDTAFVKVLRSKPLYTVTHYNNYDYTVVTDAVVKINSDGQQLVLNYLPVQQRYYTTELAVIPGRQYFLEITTPSGERVSSNCRVPYQLPPDITNIELEINPFYQEKSIRFTLPDRPGSGDYYRVSAGYVYEYPDPTYEWPAWFNSIGFQSGQEFISDVQKDGTAFLYKTYGFSSFDTPPINIYVSLTDDHYFKYHQSVNSFQDDNPFAEPTPVYSNIEGGLGVFAALRTVVTPVDVNKLNQ